MALYELLIRGKEDGTISGAHVIDYLDNGLPGLARPVQEADWPAVASEVNALLSGQITTLEAAATTKETEHKAEIDEWKAKVKAKNDTLEAVRTEKSATIDELRADKQAQASEMSYVFAQLNSALDQAKEDDADPVAVIRTVKQSIREATKSETSRKREALAAQKAEIEDQLSKLNPPEE